MHHLTSLQKDLSIIAALAVEKEEENDRFRVFLKSHEGEAIDHAVHDLNEAISAQIDCTTCGNCCKSLMVNINDAEADALSGYLYQSREEFDERYLEKGSNGLMIMNSMPCHFLDDNKCTVYEYRFSGCREFPALHLPDFNRRLFTTFMHYARCPIIFNVVEELKKEMGFLAESTE
ncbi:hypothetical protein F5148DRAFT_1295358 [Russula earlei]|uniref:Uncharacterized protein n=1 Tax=Russula earlei TaxID=71964 RepID=A0ACC0TQW9_9AGAM|nr:hypothetical protein F5148DRAFT_1295358 [Russula earlei]